MGLPFVVPPLLAIVAVRLSTPGAAVGVLLVAAIVETVTAAGVGPFAGSGASGGLVGAQMFLAMGAFTALTVAALTSDLVSRDELAASLRDQAHNDSLTGIANRRFLFESIAAGSRRLADDPGRFALIFIDLDGFERVNDRHGHAAGDAVLAQAAARVRSVTRASDIVGRLGGDEFLVLAERAGDAEQVERLVERVRAAIHEPFS